jgi:hypothetical protein
MGVGAGGKKGEGLSYFERNEFVSGYTLHGGVPGGPDGTELPGVRYPGSASIPGSIAAFILEPRLEVPLASVSRLVFPVQQGSSGGRDSPD